MTASVLKSIGQGTVRDSSLFIPLLCPTYAFQVPGADMAKSFGVSSAIGIQFFIKTKGKWIFGMSGDFIFSQNVRQTGMLDSITTTNPPGMLIASVGKLSDRQFSERGFQVFLKFGRLFSAWGPNPNSGIMATAGLGFLEHQIRIDLIDGTDQIVPQLNAEMRKGYDRLTNGIAFNEYIGYLYMGNRRIANFFFGLEVTEGFTQDRRFDYDLMKQNNTVQTDLLYSLRVGWIIPFYKKQPKAFYMY